MKLFKHVFYSWLLAIVITLAGIFIYDLATSFSPSFGDIFRPQLLIIVPAACLVALPSLFISYLFFRFIFIAYYTVYEKFLLWYVAALIAVILNIFFIPLVFAPDIIEAEIFFMLWPAYAGLLLSLSIRYKYFIRLFIERAIDGKIITEEVSE